MNDPCRYYAASRERDRDTGKSTYWPRMKQWLEESRVHPIPDPARPVIIGIDEARYLDFTTIAAIQHHAGRTFVLDVRRPRIQFDEESLRLSIDAINRDICRPSGYSRSHWRKIWKARP